MIDRKTLPALSAALAGLAGTAQADVLEYEYQIVLQAAESLAVRCFESARDGGIGADALEPCDRALAEEDLTDGRKAKVYANRGVINYNSGDYEASILDFTESLDLGVSARAKVLANRGLSYEALNMESLARADYTLALVLDGGEERARIRLEELAKPYYERSLLPRKLTVEAPPPGPANAI